MRNISAIFAQRRVQVVAGTIGKGGVRDRHFKELHLFALNLSVYWYILMYPFSFFLQK